MTDLVEIYDRLKALKKKSRVVLTVSPVPLTATASGEHVEVATTYSKSVLRAVSGELAKKYASVEYFPSYEVIMSQNARGAYFAKNLRSVLPFGVTSAMQMFLEAHGLKRDSRRMLAERSQRREEAAVRRGAFAEDVHCDDAFLDVFRT